MNTVQDFIFFVALVMSNQSNAVIYLKCKTHLNKVVLMLYLKNLNLSKMRQHL